MQANSFHVYIIGGHCGYSSLVCGEYDVERSCLRVDLTSGVLKKMNNMRHAHDLHSVVLLGKQIYVIAGERMRKCEAFDLIKAVWT